MDQSSQQISISQLQVESMLGDRSKLILELHQRIQQLEKENQELRQELQNEKDG